MGRCYDIQESSVGATTFESRRSVQQHSRALGRSVQGYTIVVGWCYDITVSWVGAAIFQCRGSLRRYSSVISRFNGLHLLAIYLQSNVTSKWSYYGRPNSKKSPNGSNPFGRGRSILDLDQKLMRILNRV